AILGGGVKRGPSMLLASVDRSTVLKQRTYHRDVSAGYGAVKRHDFHGILCDDGDVRSTFDECGSDWFAGKEAGQMECRETVWRVSGHERRVCLKKLSDSIGASSGSGFE